MTAYKELPCNRPELGLLATGEDGYVDRTILVNLTTNRPLGMFDYEAGSQGTHQAVVGAARRNNNSSGSMPPTREALSRKGGRDAVAETFFDVLPASGAEGRWS